MTNASKICAQQLVSTLNSQRCAFDRSGSVICCVTLDFLVLLQQCTLYSEIRPTLITSTGTIVCSQYGATQLTIMSFVSFLQILSPKEHLGTSSVLLRIYPQDYGPYLWGGVLQIKQTNNIRRWQKLEKNCQFGDPF